MMMECCNLIGVKHDSTALNGSADLAVVIKGVNQLLKIVQRSEVYNVSADDKGKQLQFYRHLVSVLLENKWYVHVMHLSMSSWEGACRGYPGD